MELQINSVESMWVTMATVVVLGVCTGLSIGVLTQNIPKHKTSAVLWLSSVTIILTISLIQIVVPKDFYIHTLVYLGVMIAFWGLQTLLSTFDESVHGYEEDDEVVDTEAS